MNNKRYINLKRILASYLVICMLAMAAFPYGNIVFAADSGEAGASEGTVGEGSGDEGGTNRIVISNHVKIGILLCHNKIKVALGVHQHVSGTLIFCSLQYTNFDAI